MRLILLSAVMLTMHMGLSSLPLKIMLITGGHSCDTIQFKLNII